jgi:predicted TIM-barrel fold metal-dependent hydrolase
MYDGPVIDAHTHPLLYPEGQIGEPHPPEDYRRRAAGSPVTRAAALVIAPRGDLAQTRSRNDATLRLARDSEGFFFPVCSVHPSDGAGASAEIERVAAAGCQWLKLHPNNQRFDVADPAVADVVRHATAAGLPVLFDAYAHGTPTSRASSSGWCRRCRGPG